MKILCNFIVTVTWLILMSNIAFAENPLLSKGRNYTEARMWSQAINSLNKVINAEPKNAEAHLLLGRCYLNTGNTFESNERFKSAVAISLLNNKVSSAVLYMNTNQIASARVVFDETIERRPSIRKKLASQLFDYGVRRLKDKEFNESTLLLNFAVAYDNDLNFKACDTFFKLGSIHDDAAIVFFNLGYQYCANDTKRMNEMGEKFLSMAARQPKGEERKQLLAITSRFLPQERIDEVIPPPQWKTVFEKQYVGDGFGDYDWVSTARLGVECIPGDQVFITAEGKFKVYRGKEWREFFNSTEFRNDTGKEGEIGVKARKNTNFTVTVKRLTE